MARPKRIENILDNDDDDSPADFIDIPGGFEDVTDLQDDIDSQIDAITSEFGGEDNDTEFKIHVKRILKDKGELAHLFSCLPNELPILDKLRDDYDGGNFEIWIYKNKKIFKRRKIIVEAPRKKEIAETTGDNTALIMEGFSKLGELIAKSASVVQPAFDPMASMAAMMQQMILMKEFVGGNAVPAPQQDPLEMIEKVVNIQQMMSANNPAPEASEGATNADLLIELTRTFGKPIAEMAAKAQGEVRTVPNPSASPVIVTDPTKPKTKANPMKMQLMFLINFAKKNVDPAPYAQMIIDQAPNLPELIAFIQQGNVVENMAKIHPKVGDYAGWFTELAECIIELAVDNEAEDVATDGADGGIVDPDGGIVDPDNIDDPGHVAGDKEDPEVDETPKTE